MSEPFRNDLAAALDRASILASENQSLREELARLQGRPDPPSAAAAEPAIVSPPDSMKDRALEKLERLSLEIDAHAAQVERAEEPAAVPSSPRKPATVLSSPAKPAPSPPLPLQRSVEPSVELLPAEPKRDQLDLDVASELSSLKAENSALQREVATLRFVVALVSAGAFFFAAFVAWLASAAR